MKTVVNKDERKFSLAMLLLTVVTYLGHSKFMVEYMNATIFALNYRRGIVSRGFMGWILDIVCEVLGDSFYTYKTVFVISTFGYVLYLAVLWVFAKRFIRAFDGDGYVRAFVMIMAPFFSEMFITHEGYGRTDMYLLIISLIAGYAVLKDRGIVLCVICPAIGILIHEGYVFDYYGIILACLFYKFVFNGSRKKSRYIIWIVISILFCLFVFIWVFFLSKRFLPMSDDIFAGIVSDAQRLAAPGQEVHTEFLREEVLGVDLYDSLQEYMADARVATAIFMVLFLPIIANICRFIKSVYNESEHKKTVVFLCMGPLTLVPMFVRQCDYGRWIFALVCYYLSLLLLFTLAGNKVVKEVFIKHLRTIIDSRWEPVFYTIYFLLFIPFQTVYVDDICRNIMNIIKGVLYGFYF